MVDFTVTGVNWFVLFLLLNITQSVSTFILNEGATALEFYLDLSFTVCSMLELFSCFLNSFK